MVASAVRCLCLSVYCRNCFYTMFCLTFTTSLVISIMVQQLNIKYPFACLWYKHYEYIFVLPQQSLYWCLDSLNFWFTFSSEALIVEIDIFDGGVHEIFINLIVRLKRFAHLVKVIQLSSSKTLYIVILRVGIKVQTFYLLMYYLSDLIQFAQVLREKNTFQIL